MGELSLVCGELGLPAWGDHVYSGAGQIWGHLSSHVCEQQGFNGPAAVGTDGRGYPLPPRVYNTITHHRQ